MQGMGALGRVCFGLGRECIAPSCKRVGGWLGSLLGPFPTTWQGGRADSAAGLCISAAKEVVRVLVLGEDRSSLRQSTRGNAWEVHGDDVWGVMVDGFGGDLTPNDGDSAEGLYLCSGVPYYPA